MPKTPKATAPKNASSRSRLGVRPKPPVPATPTVDDIAEMATRGEDISVYFTNRFTVFRPGRRVNVELADPVQPVVRHGRDKVR
jgi:hypothetical protein